ncbi:DUF6688 domain-containing protein [Ohessyouella blattaphilus]|uniref:Uncharacterized protein n=1 Tax=Ohessyouella blattaphilus TaxID=2949333 RepID=A0ABT1EKM8_9FIRM|nr:DUF6688 family protein [Ohessyouella blattaphilus]MCP1111262.1 hypothetical protein [Ohessyouella blattaphilus]MCR8564656.1 hypothetical protein [Ohessyouella blattaphilus]
MMTSILQLLLVFFFLGMPLILTGLNGYYLMRSPEKLYKSKLEVVSEVLTFLLGVTFSLFYMGLSDIYFADWDAQLYNNQKHMPIWTEGLGTIVFFAVISLLTYIMLRAINYKKASPLILVSTIAGQYVGMLLCLLWIIQISVATDMLLLTLFPLNYILLSVKMIRYLIFKGNKCIYNEEERYQNRFLQNLNVRLQNANRWPFYAFVFTVPLLMAGIIILLLFGQRPDAIIKAWTETSDWRLSLKEGPQNIYMDEHYLCTVAAGGHEQVVKPLRLGVRHGHKVIVNRQLCVANAFEELIQERLPKTHRVIRRFYDTYGFPIAKGIKSKVMADIVYILMKPLEWFFLFVLYLCDNKPENRIAVQYMGKRKPLV